MKVFSQLFKRLEATNSVNAKVEALVSFFREANDQDKLWAIALFTHKRPKRTINTRLLREWAAEEAKISEWLFEDSYHIVGDLAETIALLLPTPKSTSQKSLSDWIQEMISLKDLEDDQKKAWVLNAWGALDKDERFLFNKFITGGFRIGVSQRLITKALSQFLNVDESQVAHRLMGDWSPLDTSFHMLMKEDDIKDNISKPYPFYLAYALDKEALTLGDPDDWNVEWKWDGIRGQFIYRKGEVFIWSRGEELVTDKFPELESAVAGINESFVIDGEILAYKDNEPLPFQELQKRIGRKKVSNSLMNRYPVIFMAYDILEFQGNDTRMKPLEERRFLLNQLFSQSTNDKIFISNNILFNKWEDLDELIKEARDRKTEGFMLKHKNSTYKDGRKKGDWWKWKVSPYTIDAVMIYAQRGHGRRANLFTDYTFALWDGDQLVPFTKAYHGLTDEEFMEVSKFVRKNTIDRFGPVHAVNPDLVFEIAFEGIQESNRHKSGIALRFPRISRWRKDKKAAEANTIEEIKILLQ